MSSLFQYSDDFNSYCVARVIHKLNMMTFLRITPLLHNPPTTGHEFPITWHPSHKQNHTVYFNF